MASGIGIGEHVWVTQGKTDHMAMYIGDIRKPDSDDSDDNDSDNDSGYVSIKWTTTNMIEYVPYSSVRLAMNGQRRRRIVPNHYMAVPAPPARAPPPPPLPLSPPPPTKKRKSRLLRELEDHLGLPDPLSSSSSDDDNDSDSDIQPPPPKIKMPPTNRKRTCDQSEDDESCDDTDDSNIDIDDYQDEDPRKDNNDVRNPQKDNRCSRKNEEMWMGMFEKLVAYKNQHNNTMVPQRYEKDLKLGQWVNTQRRNQRNDELFPKRLGLLNSVDFIWVGGSGGKIAVGNKKWMSMFQKLVEYKKEHKNTMVPMRYNEDPKLGWWVSKQRKVYKNDKLLPKRLVLMNSIDFTWNVNKAAR